MGEHARFPKEALIRSAQMTLGNAYDGHCSEKRLAEMFGTWGPRWDISIEQRSGGSSHVSYHLSVSGREGIPLIPIYYSVTWDSK